MDLAQLRYPVAFWDGVPPQHFITALTLMPSTPVPHATRTLRHMLTGSSTGELVHWSLHQDPLRLTSNALLLRVGSARVCAMTHCQIGGLHVFLTATVEGFVSIWTATGGRCVRSSLSTPFAPSVLLTFTRAITLGIGKERKRTVEKTFLVACSVHSPYVYICSLPHLRTIRVLKMDSEVPHMCVVRTLVKSTTASLSPTSAQWSDGKTNTDNRGQKEAKDALIPRPLLYCVTMSGQLHRWDLFEAIAHDASHHVVSSSSSVSHSFPTTDDDDIVLTKSKYTTLRVFPSPSPALSFVVACSASGSGNLLAVLFDQSVGIFSIVTKTYETPLFYISDLCPRSRCFAGCQFLPSYNVNGVLTVRLVLWSLEGEAIVLQICTSIASSSAPVSNIENDNKPTRRKKVLVRVIWRLQNADSDESYASVIPNSFRYKPRLPYLLFAIEGSSLIAGNNKGELSLWQLPDSCFLPITAASFVNPFADPSLIFNSDIFPLFEVCSVLTPDSLALPTAHSSIADSFALPAMPSRLRLSSVDSREVCTCSVLLTEGSGKIAMLARGFESGLIRVYGPASRSPLSPSSSSNSLFFFDSVSALQTDQTSADVLPPRLNAQALVLDLNGHSGAISCLLSIGGREFGCQHALLASGSTDATVCLWDVSTATLLKRLRLSMPVLSLHRPALTEDDYRYFTDHASHSASRMAANHDALEEVRIKEEYALSQEQRPFTAADVVNSRGEESRSPLSPVSPLSRSQSLTLPTSASTGKLPSVSSYSQPSSDVFANLTPGPGILFVGTHDHSVRSYSLLDYSLLQIFRGHDDAVLTVFLDSACVREEQVIVQTERHSVYVWSLNDGSLVSQFGADSGAMLFLQKRALIAPQSQLSILAHHLRQRTRQQLQPSQDISSTDKSFFVEEENESKPVSEKEEKEKLNLRERFALRTKTSSNLLPQASYHSRETSQSSFSTTPRAQQQLLSLTTSIVSPIHTDHAPSPMALKHPVSSLLHSNRLIDRRSQTAMLSSLNAPVLASNDSEEKTGMLLPATPSSQRTSSFSSKPTLLKRASSLLNDSIENARKSDDEIASRKLYQRDPANELATYGLHIPLVDPVIGQKKLHHTIDAVRMEGKSHLHLSVFIINLNRFSRDLERQYMQSRSATSSPLSSSTHRVHNPSANHLAVECIDPSSKDQLDYLWSTLFDWDEPNAGTSLLREHFGCHAPFPSPAFATITDNSQALTILFPSQCHKLTRWTLDADMTARQALTISTVFTPLIASADVENQSFFSKIMSYYNTAMPSQLALYVEPDISVLALFALNSNDHVNTSARLLLENVISRSSPKQRREWVDLFSQFYAAPISNSLASSSSFDKPNTSNNRKRGDSDLSTVASGRTSDQEMIAAYILILIGLAEVHSVHVEDTTFISAEQQIVDDSNEEEDTTLDIFDQVAASIANTLVRVLSWTGGSHANDIVKCILAADLVARSLPLLATHYTKPESLVHRLYLLSMSKRVQLADSAQRALLEYGQVDVAAFLSCMSKEAQSSRNSTHVRQSAFTCISSLVKRHSLALAHSLPVAASICVKCLDPNEQQMRKILLNASLATLFQLAQQYPAASMHPGSQRFAVAQFANKPAIVVYDLQKAVQSKIFDNFKSEAHALAFSNHGTLLAAYFALETPPTVRAWNIVEPGSGGSNFLNRLIHNSNSNQNQEKSLVKTWALSSIPPPSSSNSYYADAQQKSVIKWAEEEDLVFRLARSSRSKANLLSPYKKPLTLSIPDLPTSHSTNVSPISSPSSTSNGLSVSPSSTPPMAPTSTEESSVPVISAHQDAARSSALSNDETTYRELLLKCYLGVKLEWKSDTELVLTRESGEIKHLKVG